MLAGKQENFNIVGTYGRSLRRNGGLLQDVDKGTETTRALLYAINALDSAKSQRDKEYYLYVCNNIGLLGVLIEPSQVFDVVTVILCDIGIVPESTTGASEGFKFPESFASEVKKQVIQGLANIRVLYRQEVDNFLFERLELPALYTEVVNQMSAVGQNQP